MLNENPNQLELIFPNGVPPVKFHKVKKMKKKIETPMVVLNTIKDTLHKLKVTNCAYKVMLPNGEIVTHDPNKVFEKRKHNPDPNRPYKYGDLCARYKPIIENMVAGDVSSVPYDDDHPANNIMSSMTAWMSSNWGNGSYTTVTNKQAKTIEVLRLK